jgi:hypothetical protein
MKKNDATILFKLSTEDKKAIQTLADEKRISLSGHIRQILMQNVDYCKKTNTRK